MRDDLLGYLLGALDASEQQRIDRKLAENPWLREQLELLQSQLDALGAAEEDVPAWEAEPSFGLTERTCQFVEEFANQHRVERKTAGLSPVRAAAATSRGISRIDFAVCLGVFMVSTMLFFPAIAHSRFQAQIASCQDSLRRISEAVGLYAATSPDQRLPYVPVEGPTAFAGYMAVQLGEAQLIPDPNVFVCQSSELADQIRRSGASFVVPTTVQLRSATPRALGDLQRFGGGSLGFNIGYISGGRHLAARHAGQSNLAIVADAPSLTSPDGRSANHWGRGQNVLYMDGHIRFVCGCPGEACLDDPYRNNRGVVEAGIGENDAVVAPSIAPPLIQPVSLSRNAN